VFVRGKTVDPVKFLASTHDTTSQSIMRAAGEVK
jgi:hypothetical protein